jgi:hypothetical protein
MNCPNCGNHLQDGANLCSDGSNPSGVAKPMLFVLGFIALVLLRYLEMLKASVPPKEKPEPKWNINITRNSKWI